MGEIIRTPSDNIVDTPKIGSLITFVINSNSAPGAVNVAVGVVISNKRDVYVTVINKICMYNKLYDTILLSPQ